MKTRRAQLTRWFTLLPVLAVLFGSCGGGGTYVSPEPSPPPPLTITTASLADGVKGLQYTQGLEATGGTSPYTWTLASGTLPGGLTVYATGAIAGYPTEVGRFEFTVKVQDSASRTASSVLHLVVADPLLTPNYFLFDATFNLPFNQTLQATGGTPPYTWAVVVGGGLPPGLTLTADGVLSGTPTEPGEFNSQVYVRDTGAPPQSHTVSLYVHVWKDLTILTQTLPLGVVTHAYYTQLQAAGGTPPYTWQISDGSLAPGLILNTSTGEISGIPTEPQYYHSFLLEASDSSTPIQTATRRVYHTINPTVSVSSAKIGDGVKDSYYRSCLLVQDGQPPYTARIIAGVLPPGLSLAQEPWWDGEFLITGTPTALGTYSFTVEVTDSSSPPDTATGDKSIRINEKLVITTTSLPVGWTGDPYSASLSVTGGVPPYGYYVQPSPPEGLTFGSLDGQITGTPLQPFAGSLFFQVHDSADPRQLAYANLTLRIIGRLGITTSRVPAARPNVPYRVKLGLFGGTAPYAWSITSGVLPSGLTLNTTSGEISGTPTAEEARTFTVQVTDTGPPVQTASRQLSLTITNSLGRNDTIATATPISNGTFRASISPYADPASGPAYPDNDYYLLTANPGATVTVETVARRLYPASPLDSVIEIVDSAGTRFNTCRAGYWFFPCLNDDLSPGSVLDSKLEFRVPGTGSEPVTFYVRVLDWRGDARPDFVYELIVSGAN
jgi:hypothetical protein